MDVKPSTVYFDRSNSNVAKRECSDCGGELVLAVRANQSQPSNGDSNQMGSASTNWRCSTCGSTFTAAQLREDKRERAKHV
jgi:ribosomal protein S27E